MHFEDVLLARAGLDKAVVAVRADVWLLAGVDLQTVHQSRPLANFLFLRQSFLHYSPWLPSQLN